jgi:hypothetical protein
MPRNLVDKQAEREPSEDYSLAAVGALYASLVFVVVIAILDTNLGRDLTDRLGAPVRAMIAVPVLVLATVVFGCSVAALVLPAWRRGMLRLAGIASWLIPAWLVIAAVLIGSLILALKRLG